MSALPDWLKAHHKTQVIEKPSVIEPHRVHVKMKSYGYAQPRFVEFLLDKVFRRSAEDIPLIALRVHLNETALVGTYTKDVAETKAVIAETYIHKGHQPLKITLENE